MIKVLMQRALPAGFDVSDDSQLAQYARLAADMLANVSAGAHWLTSYIAEGTLFTIVVFPTEADVERYCAATGLTGQANAVRRIARTFDASFAKDPE